MGTRHGGPALAELYGVCVLNRAVKRNAIRFSDFAFQLTVRRANLKCQIGTCWGGDRWPFPAPSRSIAMLSSAVSRVSLHSSRLS